MQMNSLWTLAVAAAAAFGSVEAVGAGAAVGAAADASYGSPADHMPIDQALRVGPDTRSVTVHRLETVRFSTGDGRQFTWRFDTERPGVFPLARIAPAGVAVPSNAMVYVMPEIPISP
jgi:hypothetical protein